jgi:membrane protein DedA with SNARE-associated domain
MDELNARLADIQNARATTVKLVEAGSAISWGAPVVSVLVVAGFLALVGGMMFRTVPDSQVALVLFGSLSTAFGSVISYWLGSSAGSKDKDAMLASIAKGGR